MQHFLSVIVKGDREDDDVWEQGAGSADAHAVTIRSASLLTVDDIFGVLCPVSRSRCG